MELTARQAFKFGFLRRCAQEGLDEGNTQERLTKAASLAASFEKQALPSLRELLSPSTYAGVLFQPPVAALGAGASLGGLGGYILAKAQEGTLDPEDAQKRELIAAYDAYGKQVAMRDKLRKLREGRGLPYPYSSRGM